MNFKKLLLALTIAFIAVTAKAQLMHFDSILCVNPATQERAVVTLDFRIASQGSWKA